MDERPSEGSSQIVAERPVETTSSAYGVTKQAGVLERPLRCFSSFDEAREERKRVVTNIETKAVAKRRTNLRLTLLVSFRGGGVALRASLRRRTFKRPPEHSTRRRVTGTARLFFVLYNA